MADGLAPGPIRVRMAIHTGTPYLGEEGYVGSDVHRGARIAASGHGVLSMSDGGSWTGVLPTRTLPGCGPMGRR